MISAQIDPIFSLFLPIFVTHLMLHGCICLCFAEYSSKSKIPGKEGEYKELCVTRRYGENKLAQKGAKEGPTSCEKPGGITPQVDGWPAVPTTSQPSH